jgi:predicted secreted Zn-dependent protease
MRRLISAWVLAACVSGLSGAAVAGVHISEKTQNYAIAGKTGMALVDAMDRRGPKHGLLTRAIAQTGYSVSWQIEWGETRDACRVKRVDGQLAITYTYPRVAGSMPADLNGKWSRFMAGVRKHEGTHADLARQMARAAERSVASLTIRNDPNCRKSRAEVKRRMAAIYADYEARQLRFDAKEHREGGNVERLIGALVRRP